MTGLLRCVRCKGRKKLFRVNSAYSAINTGGVEMECPMCLGTGFTKTPKEVVEEIQKRNDENYYEEAKKASEQATKIYEEAKEIVNECIGERQENTVVSTANTSEKIKDKKKSARDAEKTLQESE